MKWEKYLKIIGPAIFIYILFQIDFGQLFSILKNINLFYFFLSLVLWFPLIFIRAAKWRRIIDFLGERVSFRKILPMFVKGIFWGLITPARLGEFYRAKYLKEHSGLNFEKALWTVILDRIVDLLGVIFLSIIFVFSLIYFLEVKLPLMLLIFLALAFLFLGLFLIYQRKSQAILVFFLNILLPQSFKSVTENFIADFFENLKNVRFSFFLKLFSYELLCYLSMALANLSLAHSLGLNIPFWYLFLIDAFIALIVSLPISILGLGTREVAIAFLFSPFGVNVNQAVTFSLVMMFLNMLLGVPGLILFLSKESKKKHEATISTSS